MFIRSRWLLLSLVVVLIGSAFFATILWHKPVKEVVAGVSTASSATPYRPYLEYYLSDSFTGGIRRQTIIYIYAKSGETLVLGSSAVGLGQAKIDYTSPSGERKTCQSKTGQIRNLQEENAGPAPVSGGFTPCLVDVNNQNEGVWRIDFIPPNPYGSGNPKPLKMSESWTQSSTDNFITAWYAGVRVGTNQYKKGRTFTNYLALNLGNYAASLVADYYVQTKDGYTYQVSLPGTYPYGFIFFSNNRGYLDNSGKQISRSLQLEGSGANPTLPDGYKFHSPANADTVTDWTNKIFFETPANDLPAQAKSATGTIWLKNQVQKPSVGSGFQFVGLEGTVGVGGTTGLGGYFEFQADKSGTARITLDLNKNGILGDGNDKLLVNQVQAGKNRYFWDGLDGLGKQVPAGKQEFNSSIEFTAGEVHFPFLDVENNPNGLIIKRINPSPADYTIYYDDRNLVGEIPPVQPDQRKGENSVNGAHRWGYANPNPNNDVGFGNKKAIDTWTYTSSEPLQANYSMSLNEADVSIEAIKPKFINTTNVKQVELEFTLSNFNTSPNDSPESKFQTTLPASLKNVRISCEIVNPGMSESTSCGAENISGKSVEKIVSIAQGGSIKIKLLAEIDSSFDYSQAQEFGVTRGRDTGDPNLSNNKVLVSFDGLDVLPFEAKADLVLRKESTGNFQSGAEVEYRFTVENMGPDTANGPIQIVDDLPSQIEYLRSVSPNWNCTISGKKLNCQYPNSLPLGEKLELIIKVKVNV